jgi:hypothetical protein
LTIVRRSELTGYRAFRLRQSTAPQLGRSLDDDFQKGRQN